MPSGDRLLDLSIGYCETHGDYVSRQLFRDILDAEEEHGDWLEIQLGLIEKMGIENFIRSKT